ncbi:Iron-sulfur cluster carrier protein [subsurface metagenome]|nr:4Fe-4S dicluster domain-containing protein [bacterium]
MIIAIASGKGGTGKTLVATNLAAVIPGATYADCDAEEPNGHLFLKPQISDTKEVYVQVPEIDNERCTGCGECARHCAFNALAVVKSKVLIFSELCHGCGVCSAVCPEGAIKEKPYVLGKVRTGTFLNNKRFVDGTLAIGQLRSAEVIEQVVDSLKDSEMVILDAPPGTSCAVVAATRRADACLLVTEPTPFGLHDLRLARDMLTRLRVPCAVLINRADIGDEEVERYCKDQGIPVLARIPFDRKIAAFYAEGKLIVDEQAKWRDIFSNLARKLSDIENYSLPDFVESEEKVLDQASVSSKSAASVSAFSSFPVLSGKGGTGKTMLASCLAAAWEDKVCADADVDAANLGILLEGEITEEMPFSSGLQAEIDSQLCTGCGTCVDACHFSAIEMKEGEAYVQELFCEGCGLCQIVCPAEPNAVTLQRPRSGGITIKETPYGDVVSAELFPGAEASGRLVTEVRKTAERICSQNGAGNILIDGSPGIGCPVNAALTGTHGVLLVAEPSISSLHDLGRILKLLDFFSLKRWVVINKYDLSLKLTGEIEGFCRDQNVPVLGRIPFDRTITESITRAQIPSADSCCNQARLLQDITERVLAEFEKERT